jgi:wobble nucleotide-excising tRNase
LRRKNLNKSKYQVYLMQCDKEKMKRNLRKAIEDPNIKPEFKELAEELLELLDGNEELALEIIGLR